MKGQKTLISVLVALMLIFSFAGNTVFAASTVTTLVETDYQLSGGIAVDSSDRVYYCVSRSLHRIDADGQNDVILADGFINPRDITVDRFGNIYVVDYPDRSSLNRNTIVKLNENGQIIATYTPSDLEIFSLDVDSGGNLYFTQAFNIIPGNFDAIGYRTSFFDPYTNSFGVINSDIGFPLGLAVDSTNMIYVADYSFGEIIKMDPHGQKLITFNAGLHPRCVAVDSLGYVYYCDDANDAVKKMDANGENIIKLTDGFGGSSDIEVDSQGNVYIPAGNNIFKIASSSSSPVIVTQPASQNVELDEAVILSVAAEVSQGTLTYQWFAADSNAYEPATVVEGATAPDYLPPTDLIGTTYYFCEITNTDGTLTTATTSDIASVTVNLPAPVITTQPVSQSVYLDEPVTLSVEAEVAQGTLAYQWFAADSESYTPAAAIEGATDSDYLPPTDLVGTAYYFCEIANNGEGLTPVSITSDIASITVIQPTPETIIDDTIEEVESLEIINLEHSIISKLGVVSDKIESSDIDVAANQLVAFIKSVEAKSGKTIDPETADFLIECAQEILELLEQ